MKLRKAAVSSVVDHKEGGSRGNYNVYEYQHYSKVNSYIHREGRGGCHLRREDQRGWDYCEGS